MEEAKQRIFAGALRHAIEDWATQLLETSKLAQLARDRALTPRALAYYLTSLRYLFYHSQRNLSLAARCATQQERTALAHYFSRKAGEEVGHDGWAEDDLAKLPSVEVAALEPAPAVVELVELQRALIREHPFCFAVYALWAEYFTVLLGDTWLELLAGCGFERSQVSAIAKHVDADREHAARGFDELETLWDTEPSVPALLAVIDRAGATFVRFCDEVCEEARRAA